MTSITNIWLIFIVNIFKIPIMADHTLFDLSNLLRSILSSILSYCSTFRIHTNAHLRKFEDNIYHLPQKQF